MKPTLFMQSLAFSAALAACSRPSASTTKVVGGERDSYSFPGSLRMRGFDSQGSNSGLCTGAFVRDDLFMTAGHCFREFPTASIEVAAEAGYFRDHPAYSNQLIVHPKFKNDNYYNQFFSDVAFARFPRGTAPSELVVKLAPATPQAGDKVYIVGWGRTDLNKPNSAWTRNVGSNRVNTIWDQYAHAIVLWRQANRGGTDNAATGNGDSGGPLYDAQGRALGIVHGGWLEDSGQVSHYTNFNDPNLAWFVRSVMSGNTSF